MPVLVVSQGSAAGVALLAAFIKQYIAEDKPLSELYALYDFGSTTPRCFWESTLKLLAEGACDKAVGFKENGSGQHEIVRDVKWTPSETEIYVLRISLDTDSDITIEQSRTSRNQWLQPFKSAVVTSDPNYRAYLGQGDNLPKNTWPHQSDGDWRLRLPRSSKPGLLPDVEHLLNVTSACLYEVGHEAFLPYARALHVGVRQENGPDKTLLEILNGETATFQFDFNLDTLQTVKEDNFLLLCIHDSDEENKKAVNGDWPNGWLHHVLQQAILKKKCDYGLGYTIVNGVPVEAVLITACSSPAPANLDLRLKRDPTAHKYKWEIPNMYKDGQRRMETDKEHLRKLLTTILPTFMPELRSAIRSENIKFDDHFLQAPNWLSPRPREGAFDPWQSDIVEISGQPGPLHPLVAACTALASDSPKSDRIRAFAECWSFNHGSRWHQFKDNPEDTTHQNACLDAFKNLWNGARLPWPKEEFQAYPSRDDHWKWFETVWAWARRTETTDNARESISSLYLHGNEPDAQPTQPGPLHERFFCLDDFCGRYEQHLRSSNYWTDTSCWFRPDQLRATRCLMWAPEVREYVFQVFFNNLDRHAKFEPGFDFFRVRLEPVENDNRHWVQVSMLCSSPRSKSVPLEELLAKIDAPDGQLGLRLSRDVVLSYGGQVEFRSGDGTLTWRHQGASPQIDRDNSVKIVLAGNDNNLSMENDHIVLMGQGRRPDVQIEGLPKPRRDCATIPSNCRLKNFLEECVGFEAVYRFPKLE